MNNKDNYYYNNNNNSYIYHFDLKYMTFRQQFNA